MSRPSSRPECGFDTGHNRKTDAHDAHSIAVVAVRTKNLRVLQLDVELEALRMLIDRREALTRRRVQTVDRLQALLAELLPGQAKRDITTGQAKAMLASVRPRDIAGKTRRRIAAEELAELVAVEVKIKRATAELKAIVLARGSHLMDLHGVGPVVAGWVCARDAGALVGWVNLAWDGAGHAFVLDTLVRATHRRRGVATALVGAAVSGARDAGCEWVHVDFEDRLAAFYLNGCGFTSTNAGLIRL